jgi:hypothetical protein
MSSEILSRQSSQPSPSATVCWKTRGRRRFPPGPLERMRRGAGERHRRPRRTIFTLQLPLRGPRSEGRKIPPPPHPRSRRNRPLIQRSPLRAARVSMTPCGIPTRVLPLHTHYVVGSVALLGKALQFSCLGPRVSRAPATAHRTPIVPDSQRVSATTPVRSESTPGGPACTATAVARSTTGPGDRTRGGSRKGKQAPTRGANDPEPV